MRSLTGIKPTGDIHLGNYLGAVLPAVHLQEKYSGYYFVADYHALTTVTDPKLLRVASREIVATYLACGLDPVRNVLFRQSDVPEVCELTWILSCQIPMGVLERGHAVKSAKEGGKAVNVGTWFYPVLMSADILLYDANVVPVGRDQKQHVEIARDIAVKVNHHYGEGTLVVPEVSITKDTAIVPGVDGRKMSKSYGNAIPLWLPPTKLRKRIMRIVTDSKEMHEPKNPDACTVFGLYKLFATPPQERDLRAKYLEGGIGYGHAKQALFDVVDEHLAETRDKFHHWMEHPTDLDDVLDDGARRARKAASATMDRIRTRVGLN
ncbi:MAG: tryptophanyl-tRNA synthetase [Kiritimatiellia bacterium]|jgi:tryptophanyl-tRNA synthetase